MKEIKFRVWNKEDKQMYEVSSIDFLFELINWKPNKDGSETRTFMEWDKCELMQYTGLKDRNDKEVYEGDILAFEPDFWDGIVKWWDEKACYFLADEEGYASDSNYCYDADEWYQGEVIGNIYENPELLSVKCE